MTMRGLKPQGDHDTWQYLSTDAVLKTLQTNATGLSEVEAESRLATYGANRLPELAKRSALIRFLLHFHIMLIHELMGCADVTAALDH
jgi:magnesium-transporting ATPase (P-type)